MNVRLLLQMSLALGALSLSAAEVDRAVKTDAPLVAHEWGTFTSVANPEGNPVGWAPLFGAPDLPCFVASAGWGRVRKESIPGYVRMETPVLYFYSQKPQTLSVHVDFPLGLITEWYPKASKVELDPDSPGISIYRNGSIEWNDVQVLPGQKLNFPTSKGASRYYAARETDAAPLRIGDQQEKMIFYRGVGTFLPPLRPKYLSDGRVELRNERADTIPIAILFRNHDGKIGYRTIGNLKEPVTIDAPAMRDGAEAMQSLHKELFDLLVKSGLYAKEAEAMLATWSDSWFEEGTRVFYLVPRAQTDALLPLTVTPAPSQVERVFVGRVEVLSPADRQMLQHAVDVGDSATLAKVGRFLSPFSQQLTKSTNAAQTALINLQQASGSATCIP
jgi:hypothetical protein